MKFLLILVCAFVSLTSLSCAMQDSVVTTFESVSYKNNQKDLANKAAYQRALELRAYMQETIKEYEYVESCKLLFKQENQRKKLQRSQRKNLGYRLEQSQKEKIELHNQAKNQNEIKKQNDVRLSGSVSPTSIADEVQESVFFKSLFPYRKRSSQGVFPFIFQSGLLAHTKIKEAHEQSTLEELD